MLQNQVVACQLRYRPSLDVICLINARLPQHFIPLPSSSHWCRVQRLYRALTSATAWQNSLILLSLKVRHCLCQICNIARQQAFFQAVIRLLIFICLVMVSIYCLATEFTSGRNDSINRTRRKKKKRVVTVSFVRIFWTCLEWMIQLKHHIHGVHHYIEPF